jgi:hypothetical protein
MLRYDRDSGSQSTRHASRPGVGGSAVYSDQYNNANTRRYAGICCTFHSCTTAFRVGVHDRRGGNGPQSHRGSVIQPPVYNYRQGYGCNQDKTPISLSPYARRRLNTSYTPSSVSSNVPVQLTMTTDRGSDSGTEC